MSMTQDEAISVLNRLIKACRDDEVSYRHAVDSVASADLKQVLARYAGQRTSFADDLHAEVMFLNGDPRENPTLAALAHLEWTSVREAISGRDDAEEVLECERAEEDTIADYRDVLEMDLPADLRKIVNHQYCEIRRARDMLLDVHNSLIPPPEAELDPFCDVDEVAVAQAD